MAKEANELSPAELIFVQRMAPHVMAGLSFGEAAKAVLADDERLWLSAGVADDVGQAIRDELCADVHSRIRSAA